MSLDAQLLAAHKAGDILALVRLYTEAAEKAADEARGFFLTQAYVYALECGDAAAPGLRAALAREGRI